MAENNEVTSFLDTEKGEFAFVVLIKSFKFQKALMEEHFNENYMESNTYPKASFKGMIEDKDKIDFNKNGNYNVTVKGDLTIHGVKQSVEVPGSITVDDGGITASSKFKVKVRDYNIKIPMPVINNIAEEIEISVNCRYDPYKKN